MPGVLNTETQTLPELLRTRASELGDARFVRNHRVAWSYAEFDHRVTEIAAGLRAAGVQRGDVVGVVLRNGPEYLEAWWAILWLGAVFNPVNPDLTAREALGILEDSGASTIVCEAARAASSPALARATLTPWPEC
jgi:crotonobetaine/carnitine-CoA ligase